MDEASAIESPATRDVRLLFVTRSLRMFAYGLLAVILVLYLIELGLSAQRIGLLLTLTLAGDTVISLWLTTRADRVGRRRMLVVGAGLMTFAGVVFAVAQNPWVLLSILFWRLTRAVEVDRRPAQGLVKSLLGLHESRGVVLRLSALFALDAFAGGFVMDSFLSDWLHVRFGANVGVIGAILSGAN